MRVKSWMNGSLICGIGSKIEYIGIWIKDMMRFEMRHKFFKDDLVQFSELDAPDWLTSINTIPGSTMDDRWFWTDYVLTLQIGKSVKTDFQTITRVE